VALGLEQAGSATTSIGCYTLTMLDCVMPAAGASSRMRSSRMRPGAGPGGAAAGLASGAARGGSFKPLLPFRDSTLVECAAAAALGADCRLLLVVGYRGDEVAALFQAPRYREAREEEGRLLIVRNPGWERGLLGSIQAALSLVRSEAFFIALADMPFLRPEDYAALASARDSPSSAAGDCPSGDRAYFASCGGRRGHPVLLPSAWIPAIAALSPEAGIPDAGLGGPDAGLRGFLRDRASELVEIGEAALRDIDSPGDYELAAR
jgi:molybdenum cofactor cytidylyltransferase